MYVTIFIYCMTHTKKLIIVDKNNKCNTKNKILNGVEFCYRFHNNYNNYNQYLYRYTYNTLILVSGSLTQLPRQLPQRP